ncbi:morn repeat incomplete domain containing protein [Pandoravirus celtis]|uniref:Morn repeat incomplete domain containing protein n=1 Tax=Pandoravirus celtis TaxID=2568002 RepID=A0A4D6EJ63_9VIRU|nr:morn repeat incomplete domain containing protein [Pandoravirus celtis]
MWHDGHMLVMACIRHGWCHTTVNGATTNAMAWAPIHAWRAQVRGHWQDDKRAGHGIATWSDGTHHVGLWADDVRNGRACVPTPTAPLRGRLGTRRSTVVGSTRGPTESVTRATGKRASATDGACASPEWQSLRGDWKDGVRDGWGVYAWANGERYEGQFRDGKRGGYGVCLYVSGARYMGHWEDDVFNGHGLHTWPDGACYNGEFRNGRRDGHGTCVYADKGRHEGRWESGVPHGQGMTIFGNGDRYTGDHVDGKFNGGGVYSWVDGRRHDGQWQQGKADGTGTRHYPDGSCARGQWLDGSLVSGEVVCHRAGGSAPCCNGPRCAACMTVMMAQLRRDLCQSIQEQ